MADPLRCFDPAHRSYSGDKLWDECQMLAHLVDTGEVVRSFQAKVARGSAVDDAAMALIQGQDPIDLAGALARYRTEYGCTAYDEAKEMEAATGQVALFEREVLPLLPDVLFTQLEVHWALDDVVYHAHLDIVYADGAIDDLKTSDQRLGVRRADEDPQLTTYAAALLSTYGNLAPRVGLIGLINGKEPEDIQPDRKAARKPWVDRQTSVRTPVQIAVWEDEARRREAARRWAKTTGIYQTQARSSPYGCNGCAAKALCPAWRGYDLGTEAITREEAA